jgi:acyl carrier protein
MTEKIIKLMAEKLSLNESEITAEANIKDDLGVDSLDLFELIIALEEEFGIEIPQEDVTEINSVKEIVEYLQKRGI